MKTKMRKLFVNILIVFFIVCGFSNAQTDLAKWQAKPVSYTIAVKQEIKTSLALNLSARVVSAARSVYKLLFSDIDGDNCPFYPTCSRFYVDAVNETDFIRGSLMFADRFTRDVNFFKGMNHYTVMNSGKLFDPAYNYTLQTRKIKISDSANDLN